MKIALIGAPNVGKSTLFNRLAGRRIALTHSQPGMTRDWLESHASIYDLKFDLIDTAGIDPQAVSDLAKEMNAQSLRAIQAAEIIFFMIDENIVVHKDLANFIRASFKKTGQKQVLLLMNKIDRNHEVLDCQCLGFGDPIGISAEHNIGISDIYYRLLDIWPEGEKALNCDTSSKLKSQNKIKIVFVGRPNAGKSSLINATVGGCRLITSKDAGTTHDAVAVDWLYKGRNLVLTDTAGQRKRSKVVEHQEFLYVNSANKASTFADVVVLVVDALYPLEKQDLTIARHAYESGKPVAIALNKWDLVKNQKAVMEETKYQVSHALSQLGGEASIIPVSAVKSQNLNKLIDYCIDVYGKMGTEISTSKLNQWLKQALEEKAPPLFKQREVRIKYITQIGTHPLKFVLFANTSVLLKSYERYLLNSLRQAFSLWGGPLVFQYRKEENPYN
ncbi:MAG: ribosome biogenesis GTPase Der [Holosporales bacterium]|jgi:GTP-binding protein|nr:ribosome biogenesis GTPase Der [Holosporales bacterium]